MTYFSVAYPTRVSVHFCHLDQNGPWPKRYDPDVSVSFCSAVIIINNNNNNKNKSNKNLISGCMCRTSDSANSIISAITNPVLSWVTFLSRMWSRWCVSLHVNVWHIGNFSFYDFFFVVCQIVLLFGTLWDATLITKKFNWIKSNQIKPNQNKTKWIIKLNRKKSKSFLTQQTLWGNSGKHTPPLHSYTWSDAL